MEEKSRREKLFSRQMTNDIGRHPHGHNVESHGTWTTHAEFPRCPWRCHVASRDLHSAITSLATAHSHGQSDTSALTFILHVPPVLHLHIEHIPHRYISRGELVVQETIRPASPLDCSSPQPREPATPALHPAKPCRHPPARTSGARARTRRWK
jgi:hypothetical protein